MKPKIEPAPRTWWVNWKELRKSFGVNWETWFSHTDGFFIRTTKPKSTKGWIKIREVKPLRKVRKK